jgi:hypothetical protein
MCHPDHVANLRFICWSSHPFSPASGILRMPFSALFEMLLLERFVAQKRCIERITAQELGWLP